MILRWNFRIFSNQFSPPKALQTFSENFPSKALVQNIVQINKIIFILSWFTISLKTFLRGKFEQNFFMKIIKEFFQKKKTLQFSGRESWKTHFHHFPLYKFFPFFSDWAIYSIMDTLCCHRTRQHCCPSDTIHQ